MAKITVSDLCKKLDVTDYVIKNILWDLKKRNAYINSSLSPDEIKVIKNNLKDYVDIEEIEKKFVEIYYSESPMFPSKIKFSSLLKKLKIPEKDNRKIKLLERVLKENEVKYVSDNQYMPNLVDLDRELIIYIKKFQDSEKDFFNYLNGEGITISDSKITPKKSLSKEIQQDKIQKDKATDDTSSINNQAQFTFKNPKISHDSLQFRSQHEIAVYEELKKKDIVFFPLPVAVFGSKMDKDKKEEPDFLICYKGKWGILEVDGSQHEGSREKDHQRDRLFKRHGIRSIESYSAKKSIKQPDVVVNEFLELLDKCY